MPNRKALYSILLFLTTLAIILAGIFFYSQNQELTVNSLDVGQGDAILISKGNKQILIDGGPSGQILLEKLGRYIPFWDRNIEIVIATHPDQDHIDGLIDAMKAYNIGRVIDSGVSSDTQVYKKFKEIMGEKKISEMEAVLGMKLKIGEAEMEILNPDGRQTRDNPKDTNISSVVLRLSFGENSFIFTGDMASEGEADLIGKKLNLGSRVLKVAHHGSKYSTSAEFLEAVRPEDAVLSVGKNNRYGHPAQEVLERLNERRIRILRTDEKQDIRYVCNKKRDECILSD